MRTHDEYNDEIIYECQRCGHAFPADYMITMNVCQRCDPGTRERTARNIAGYGTEDTPAAPRRSSYTDDAMGQDAFMLALQKWAVYCAISAMLEFDEMISDVEWNRLADDHPEITDNDEPVKGVNQ